MPRRPAPASSAPTASTVLQIVANLRAETPAEPTVILLGGSSAREATIDDQDWAAEILDLGGPHVLAYNLGCKHDTFALDREVADLLPQDMPAIVYIGINIGRFCNAPSSPSIELPDPVIPPDFYSQHVYSADRRIQSASLKRYYVRYWLAKRRPEFNAHYRYNIEVLESVVQICQDRGLHPVLVDLPRDLPIIGHSFDAEVARYKAGCKQVAASTQIPWLTFVSAAGFVDRDFFDIFHLVEPGRSKYQYLLSQKTVRLLDKYGLEDPRRRRRPRRRPLRLQRPEIGGAAGTGRRAGGRRPSGPSDRAAEAAVLLEVLLVIVLGRPPLRRRHDAGDDGPAGPALCRPERGSRRAPPPPAPACGRRSPSGTGRPRPAPGGSAAWGRACRRTPRGARS